MESGRISFHPFSFAAIELFPPPPPPPSPPFPRRRPTHFWFIWGLCLKRVKVSQRARSLNFLAEQLSTVLEIPRLVKRKTYAEFLSLKETDLLVVCLLWTKGHAMPNPSIAITSGFFANGSFFFFFSFVSCIYLSRLFLGKYWIFCTLDPIPFIHSNTKSYTNSFSPIFKTVGKAKQRAVRHGAARSFKSCHAAAVSLNHSCNSSKVDNSASNFIRWSKVILWMKYGWQSENSKSIV